MLYICINKKRLTILYVFRNTSTNVCESLWDDFDDTLFSEICGIDEIKKVNEDLTKSDHNGLLSENLDNSTKRKYCAIESNHHNQENIEKNKKFMIKQLKNNSLFK